MKKRRKAEIVIGASIVAVVIIFLVLGFGGASAASSGLAVSARAGSGITAQLAAGAAIWAAYYGNALAGSLKGFLYGAIILISMIAIMLVIWSLGGGFLAMAMPERFSAFGTGGKADPRRLFVRAVRHSRDVLLVIPAILFIALAGIAMGQANAFARDRLADVAVIGWEHAMFGTYVFAALGAVHYPHWLIAFIIWSFDNMAFFLIGIAVLISYIAVNRFRELLVAFCIGILAMIPIWLLVPALSPQDRFINNVYRLPVPPGIAAAVASYHPQPEIANFLQSIRNDKAGLPALPTSTMPSAHIFWASLAGYYLFRARRWLGWIALPILIASSFGTVLLAQHYFIDVPLGMIIAALAIWLAHETEGEPGAAAIVEVTV
jgi:hypothetical protein